MAFKKKLHLYHPARTPVEVEARHTKQRLRREKADPQSLERGVRQLLANKTGGTMAGIWLLIPEYLRLGVWDLLRSWSGASEGEVQSRLALQLVNESALCVSGMRHSRTLGHKGFELANGLPFLATDTAIHCLLDNRSVAEAQRLQVALGKIRQTYGHFRGRLLAIDPHRITSYSKRHMVLRKTHRTDSRATKLAQSFFCLDADTQQPVCFITGTSSRTITQATQQLLSLSADILKIQDDGKPLIMADTEHYTAELFDWVSAHSPFDMLVPMPYSSAVKRAIGQLCGDSFQRHWAGYATARGSYRFRGNNGGPYHQII
ncbi:MAG: hypothetical protein GY868_18940, partial [Deltaproteobacteria bacterium]|nr:hypothetical protein [Deltaproteobacteria bacterium]